jgi:hypothetical protein
MANQPGIWDHLKDAFVISAMHSPIGGGGLARAYFRNKGYSNDQINRAIQANDQEYADKYKGDHGVVNSATSLVGHILGGVDPTYAVGGFGSSFGRRVASQAAVQGAASVGRQAIDVGTGQRKKISGRQALDDAEAGALFQGGGEAAGKAVGAVVKGARKYIPKLIHDDEVVPANEAPLAPDGFPGNGSVRPIDPKVMARIMNDPEAAGITGINDNVPNRRLNNRDRISDEDLQALPPANREYVQQELAQEPVLTPAETQEMDASVDTPPSLNNASDRVDNVSTDAPPPAPANDIHDAEIIPLEEPSVAEEPKTGITKVKDFFKTLMDDERGSLGDGNRFEEHKEDPDGTKYLHYTTDSGDKLPIKMGIDPDGTAEIAVDQFGSGTNKLGPAEIRSAMYGLMDRYPEIKRFGGYRRSGAGKGRVQEIEPAPRKLTDILANEEGSFTPWGRNKKPKLEDIPDEELTPEQRVMKGIRAADPVREAQEAAYRVERAKRFEAASKTKYVAGGEEGFHQELHHLSGEMEQLPSPYSIRPKLEQADVDNLYNQVRDHPALSYTDTLHARTGLQKLLANSGASVPTRSELDVLRKVFPEDPKAAKKTVSGWISDIINAPRSIMASTDLSAPLRQGLPMIHRKEYWTAFASMFKQLGPKAFDEVKNEIASRPSYHLMRDSGLALTDVDADLSKHEERFMSDLATKIPVFGHVVKASERAYVGFLNKLRADTFDSLVNNARAAGQKLTPKDINGIAEYINTATGRGDLNGLIPKFLRGEEFDANKASPLLSGTLFSPRLMASRIQMLNPVYYMKLPPIARKEALKSLFAMTATVTTVLGLAHAAGLSVETDPTSTDFAKIKVGNTRYDPTGGFQSYIRLAAQLMTGKKKGVDGTETSLTSGKFGQPTRLDAIGSFLKNKESPAASFAHDLLTQQDRDYNRLDAKHPGNIAADVGKDFIPLVIQDMMDVYKEQGAKGVGLSVAPDLFGVGVQTYSQKKKKAGGKESDNFSTGFGKSDFGNSNLKGGF